MKRDLFVIFLCFIAGLGGANIQPLLTGDGKLRFPEGSPPAYINAATGQINIVPGGVFPSGGTAWILPVGGTGLANFSKFGLSINTNAIANYMLDANGDVNSNTTYRIAGTSGGTSIFSVRNSAGTGSCSLTFQGGLFISSTC